MKTIIGMAALAAAGMLGAAQPDYATFICHRGYDKYEKKNDNNDTQFYVIISAIAILVIISVFKLIQKDEKEIKQ